MTRCGGPRQARLTAEIVLQIFRFGFLLLLWLFIFAAFRVVRADLFGGRAGRVGRRPAARRRGGRPQARPRRARAPWSSPPGPLAGTRITLGEQPILIGRADDSTLVLTDDFASSRHARLTNRGGQWYVEDLGSTNGTYLDQQRVQGPLLINPGQPIRIGQTVLELRRSELSARPALRRALRPRPDPRQQPGLGLRRAPAAGRRRRHGRPRGRRRRQQGRHRRAGAPGRRRARPATCCRRCARPSSRAASTCAR